MIVYDQYPYRTVVRDNIDFYEAYVWSQKNLTRGLWMSDYSVPYGLKFTLEKDYVMFLLKWS